MKRHLMIVIALGLAAAACKKEEKKDEGASKGSGSEKASGSGEASGTGSASGSGMASASGSGTADGLGSGSASGTDLGTGSGTGTGTGSAEPVKVGNTSPEGGDVMLRWKAEPAGTKYDKSETETADIVFAGTPVNLVRTKLRHVEVLESGEYVTKIKVNFEKHHEVQTVQGKSNTNAKAVEGKTYLVWRDGAAIAATLEDGSAPSPDELEELTESFDDEVGTRPGIVDMLLRHPWKTGEATALAGDDLVDLTRDLKEGANVDEATVTLKSVDGGNAVFELVMTVTTTGEATGKNQAKATFVVDIDPLRPTVIEGEVTMDMNVKGQPMSGTSKQSEKYTYR